MEKKQNKRCPRCISESVATTVIRRHVMRIVATTAESGVKQNRLLYEATIFYFFLFYVNISVFIQG